ncbi:hypothetical protein VOLCADRAFT_117252 [Volvox carteri f. nagariensis]|uniref:Uncharacterized protein n=1 Tax=Volvox carteri f. nagariensis TaxID=3068 RepID=D8TSX1_VOLCA|nr:uncharacterized protein VOLCADRAFT_117252 [Volvox carteri f. nagariensis]EFJ49555.1 hypothetical protein VOLCADRAFT_117252 [Volvox carteri f. nagariensis]|eukprot:XP_002949536.1 hypothetical protein VOLCADRAFT_117252 [Volvox carteri f. nagariensis]
MHEINPREAEEQDKAQANKDAILVAKALGRLVAWLAGGMADWNHHLPYIMRVGRLHLAPDGSGTKHRQVNPRDTRETPAVFTINQLMPTYRDAAKRTDAVCVSLEKLRDKWNNLEAGKSPAEKGIAITVGVLMLVGILTCLVCCVFRRGGQWRVPGLQWFKKKFGPKDKYSRYMDNQDDGF